jgi:hypothetical protein
MNRGEGSTRLAIVLSVAVAAVVAGAIVIIDPPAQRQRRLDQQRIDDLMHIRSQIDIYWKRHESIPGSLAGLASEPGFGPSRLDPATATPYDYEVEDTDSYRLCASFALDSGSGPYPRYRSNASEWDHPAGRFCFDIDVRKPESKGND